VGLSNVMGVYNYEIFHYTGRISTNISTILENLMVFDFCVYR
jgi:hypothetical protein